MRGQHSEPFFKPDWSPELFRGVMYVGHLLVLRRSLVESVGGLDSAFDGVQDFELMLRVSERTDRIEHVPRVLYHWRKLPGSVASSSDAKPGISELQAAAVNRHLERCGIPAFARPNPSLPHRAMLHPKPRAALAAGDRDRADEGRAAAPRALPRVDLLRARRIPSFERAARRQRDDRPDGAAPLRPVPGRRAPLRRAVQLLARRTTPASRTRDGELVVFLNNDTEVQTPEWLEAMVSLAERDGVGAVGPLLLYPNGTVQHAGVVLGLRGTADHVMRGFPGDRRRLRRLALLHAGGLGCDRRLPARSAATSFVELGGFDEHFATHYQDVDLCLRLACVRPPKPLHAARRAPSTTRASTRGDDYDHLDRALLLDAWGETIARGDPYYNPLSRSPAPTTDRRRGMNVVFVNYHDFTSNSAIHIFNLANELVGLGVDCAVGVPGNPATVDADRRATRSRRSTSRDARTGAFRFPDGEPPTLVHAWTPREVVRELTEELGSRYGCPYVVHLEDNEDAAHRPTASA